MQRLLTAIPLALALLLTAIPTPALAYHVEQCTGYNVPCSPWFEDCAGTNAHFVAEQRCLRLTVETTVHSCDAAGTCKFSYEVLARGSHSLWAYALLTSVGKPLLFRLCLEVVNVDSTTGAVRTTYGGPSCAENTFEGELTRLAYCPDAACTIKVDGEGATRTATFVANAWLESRTHGGRVMEAVAVSKHVVPV
jgi:hypothetical protein